MDWRIDGVRLLCQFDYLKWDRFAWNGLYPHRPENCEREG